MSTLVDGKVVYTDDEQAAAAEANARTEAVRNSQTRIDAIRAEDAAHQKLAAQAAQARAAELAVHEKVIADAAEAAKD